MKKCHQCGKSWEGSPGTQPGRGETCVHCGMDLHCCLNCALHDPSAHNQCSSRTTEWVKDKEKRNFCDEFEFSSKGGDKGPAIEEKGSMEQKWKDMFN